MRRTALTAAAVGLCLATGPARGLSATPTVGPVPPHLTVAPAAGMPAKAFERWRRRIEQLSPARARNPLEDGTNSTDASWARLPTLPAGTGFVTVFDPAHDRMILLALGQLWQFVPEGAGAWTRIDVTGPAPEPRASASAVYDSHRGRMIMFGGTGSALLDDVWALDLAGAPAWTKLEPKGPGPDPVSGHTAVYDAVGDRMIVYGGAGASGVTDRVRALDLDALAWTDLTPATGDSPGHRLFAGAICDPARNRLVVWGGLEFFGNAGYGVNDTWVLPLSPGGSWTELTSSGIPPYYGDAVFDASLDRMVVAGSGAEWSALAFAPDPAWTSHAPSSGPDDDDPAIALDAAHRTLITFGGARDCNSDGTWTLDLDGDAWSELAPAGVSPSQRRDARLVRDTVRDRLLIVEPHELWALPLGAPPDWSRIEIPGEAPAAGVPVADPGHDRVLLWTGSQAWSLALDAPAWTHLADATPEGPSGGVPLYDPVRDRLLVFDGDSLWALTLGGTPAWSRLATTGPLPTAVHAVFLDGPADRAITYGGFGPDCFALPLASLTWVDLGPPAGLPVEDHTSETVAFDPQRSSILAYGGFERGGPFADPIHPVNTLYELSLDPAPAWRLLSTGGVGPVAQVGVSLLFDPPRGRLVTFGGYDDERGCLYDDVHDITFDRPTAVWISLVTARPGPDGVALRWRTGESDPLTATLWRAGEDRAWAPLATLASDAWGDLAYVDRTAAPGREYGYRLTMQSYGGERVTAETWVRVPSTPVLALEGVRPNPARREVVAAFTLDQPRDARIELIDLAGRRHVVRDMGGLGPGPHTLSLGSASDFPPGCYFLRLVQGDRSVIRRATILR